MAFKCVVALNLQQLRAGYDGLVSWVGNLLWLGTSAVLAESDEFGSGM